MRDYRLFLYHRLRADVSGQSGPDTLYTTEPSEYLSGCSALSLVEYVQDKISYRLSRSI